MTKLNYTGKPEAAALLAWLASESVRLGGYVLAVTVFDCAIVRHCTKLPSSTYAPTDWPVVFHAGKRLAWSSARVNRCSRAGLDCKD